MPGRLCPGITESNGSSTPTRSPAALAVASGGVDTPTLIADPERWGKIVELPHSSRVREVSLQTYLTPEGDQFTMDALPANRSPEPDTSESTRSPLMASLEDMVATSPAAVRRALAIQRALGVSAAAMRGGKIVIIPPEELPLTAYDPIGDDANRALRS